MRMQQHSVDDGWGREDDEDLGTTRPFEVWSVLGVVMLVIVVAIIRWVRKTPVGE